MRIQAEDDTRLRRSSVRGLRCIAGSGDGDVGEEERESVRTADPIEDRTARIRSTDGVRIGYQRRVIFPEEEAEMRRTTKTSSPFYTGITSDSCHLLLPPY
jgi:hypothetical protein